MLAAPAGMPGAPWLGSQHQLPANELPKAAVKTQTAGLPPPTGTVFPASGFVLTGSGCSWHFGNESINGRSPYVCLYFPIKKRLDIKTYLL